MSHSRVTSRSELIAKLCFLGLIISLSFQAYMFGDSSSRGSFYALVLLPGVALLYLDRAVAWQHFKHSLGLKLTLCLLGYWGLSLFWAEDKSELASSLKRLLTILIYLLVVYHLVLHYQRYLPGFFKGLLICAGLGCATALVSHSALDILQTDARLGVESSFGNANHAAQYFGAFAVVAYAATFQRYGKSLTTLCAVVFVLALAAMILTKTRGTLLAFSVMAVLITAMLSQLTEIKAKRWIYFAALALGLLVFYWHFPDLILNREFSFRFEIWRDALDKASQAPWLGYGLNSEIRLVDEQFDHAHNIYLQTLLYGGIVGLGLFLLLILQALKMAWKFRSHGTDLALSALLFFLLAVMTDHHGLVSSPGESWVVFWFPLMVLLALAEQTKQQQQMGA